MTLLAQRTYDQLHALMRSRISSKGFAFSVRAFADGTAFVEVIFSQSNRQGSVSAILTPIFDPNDPTAIRSYRVADDNEVYPCANIGIAASRIAYMVQKAYTVLYKIRTN